MVTIINYNAGNVQSVLFAMQRLGIEAVLSNDHEQIRKADKVIFPGVGEAANTMAYLKAKGLDQLIRSLKQPVLGICLGMQLLCEHSEESWASIIQKLADSRDIRERIGIAARDWVRLFHDYGLILDRFAETFRNL